MNTHGIPGKVARAVNGQVHTAIVLPEELYLRLREAAQGTGRSLSEEIRNRLLLSMKPEYYCVRELPRGMK